MASVSTSGKSGAGSSSATGSSRKWTVDFSDVQVVTARNVPDPIGFAKPGSDQDDALAPKKAAEAESSLKQQKAYEQGMSPARNLLMMMFMLYMAGNQVHIWSIMITFSALYQPLQAVRSVNDAFKRFEDPKVDLLLPKLLWIVLNLGGLCAGLYKLNALGLLPTSAADWLSQAVPNFTEISYGS